ncbi:hypothetical protein C8Q77DRAFT_772384 [Trametes polyzona]|nr:hypothetical protein C8Q77DRAFT_772384 [Trametes polyzona]
MLLLPPCFSPHAPLLRNCRPCSYTPHPPHPPPFPFPLTPPPFYSSCPQTPTSHHPLFAFPTLTSTHAYFPPRALTYPLSDPLVMPTHTRSAPYIPLTRTFPHPNPSFATLRPRFVPACWTGVDIPSASRASQGSLDRRPIDRSLASLMPQILAPRSPPPPCPALPFPRHPSLTVFSAPIAAPGRRAGRVGIVTVSLSLRTGSAARSRSAYIVQKIWSMVSPPRSLSPVVLLPYSSLNGSVAINIFSSSRDSVSMHGSCRICSWLRVLHTRTDVPTYGFSTAAIAHNRCSL